MQASPDRTTTYRLSATGAGGTTTATVTLDDPFILGVTPTFERPGIIYV